jgi:hypothetical protein
MCSSALVIQPPAVPGADVAAPAAAAAADSKKAAVKGKAIGPDSKAAAAAAAKPRPGKGQLNMTAALAGCAHMLNPDGLHVCG